MKLMNEAQYVPIPTLTLSLIARFVHGKKGSKSWYVEARDLIGDA